MQYNYQTETGSLNFTLSMFHIRVVTSAARHPAEGGFLADHKVSRVDRERVRFVTVTHMSASSGCNHNAIQLTCRILNPDTL